MLRLSEQHDSLAFPLVFAPEFMNIDHIMSSLLRSGAQVYPHPVGSELPLSNLQAHLCPEHGYRLTLHKACILDLALGNWYDHFWIHFSLLRCCHSFPLFLHSEKPVYLTCVKKKSLQTFGAVICSLAHVTYVHIIAQDTNKVLQVVQLFFIGLSNMR